MCVQMCACVRWGVCSCVRVCVRACVRVRACAPSRLLLQKALSNFTLARSARAGTVPRAQARRVTPSCGCGHRFALPRPSQLAHRVRASGRKGTERRRCPAVRPLPRCAARFERRRRQHSGESARSAASPSQSPSHPPSGQFNLTHCHCVRVMLKREASQHSSSRLSSCAHLDDQHGR